MECDDVTLGVREWCRGRRCCSGGLDSYTNVSSESDEFASSTAFATRASKISALEDASEVTLLEPCLLSPPKNEEGFLLKVEVRALRKRLLGSLCSLRGPGSPGPSSSDIDAVEETHVAPCKSSIESRGRSKGERNVPVP